MLTVRYLRAQPDESFFAPLREERKTVAVLLVHAAALIAVAALGLDAESFTELLSMMR